MFCIYNSIYISIATNDDYCDYIGETWDGSENVSGSHETPIANIHLAKVAKGSERSIIRYTNSRDI